MNKFNGSIDVNDKICIGGRTTSNIDFNHTTKTLDFTVGIKPIIKIGRVDVDIDANLNVTGGINIDSGVLFVDPVNNRVGINTTTPTVALDIVGDAVISGDLTVNGSLTSFNTETLVIEDPLIKLAKNNPSDLLDTGFYSLYNDGTTKFAGLIRDSTDGVFKFFTGTTTEPTTSVDLAIGEIGDLLVDNLEATTMEISTTAVIQDLSISGQLFVNDIGISGDIIPTLNGEFDLGSTSFRFRDLFLSAGTLYIGGGQIGADDGINLYVTSDLSVIGTFGVTGDAAFNNNTLYIDATANSDGIGTTTPQTSLDIVSSDTRPLRIETTSTSQNGIEFINDTGTTGDQWQQRFDKSDTGATGSFIINHQQSGGSFWDCFELERTGAASGQLQLGTTTDSCDLTLSNGNLSITGDLFVNNSSQSIFFADSSILGTTSMAIYRKGVSGLDNRFINFESGVSSIFSPGTNVGGIRIDGVGALVIDTVSSIKLKENIRENHNECYELVKSLRGVKFDWKSGLAYDCNGFIAEEVKDIFPIASGNLNGINTVSMQSLIPVLWSALRKTQKKLEDLEIKYGCITFVDENHSYTSPEQIKESEKLLENTKLAEGEYEVYIGNKLYIIGKNGTRRLS